jgi:hypothetical protein
LVETYTTIVSLEIDVGLVQETSDLDISQCFDELAKLDCQPVRKKKNQKKKEIKHTWQ